MDGINFIQDLAVVLLAAGLAGVLCKRIGLSVIVGYLSAGMLIGPYTPPFSFITDVDRIQLLSQIGLVFLMFAIGLGLSLTKLGRMGMPTLLATGLGAFFILNLTQLLGHFVGWTPLQGLFVAAMFMVSSSAVIAKIIEELKLTHEASSQRALAITVLEDVVAVVMLTVLASQTQSSGGEANVGGLIATMSAFVVLLVGAGLLLVPRMFRRLEAKADPELQTIIVAGVLFLLALLAAKAGYSLALGAFLLGAIVAEMPQKNGVERSFAGMRDVFSSVFFVAIGMMIDVRLLLDVWPWILGLFFFVMIGRPLACGLALALCGSSPRDARRAGLLLTPLGEFSFIIAQLGVSTAVLPESYYPIAVGLSILTVLATPLINKHADSLLALAERLEPRWITRAMEAYHGWLKQLQSGQSSPLIWKLVRGRLVQIAVEALFASGLLIFSQQLLSALRDFGVGFEIDPLIIDYAFWGVIGLVVLVLLVALWRNIAAVSMLFAESAGGTGPLSAGMIDKGVRALAIIIIGYWLYLVLPIEELPVWGWLVIAAGGIGVAAVFSNRLIYWHSSWQSSVHDVFSAEPADARVNARLALDQGLSDWGLRLTDCIVPDKAAYAGQELTRLALHSRFNTSLVEIERNGHVITAIRPDLRVYPGDKLLLLGAENDLEAAQGFLAGERQVTADEDDGVSGTILETATMTNSPAADQTLAQLGVARATGARIVGIQRGEERILNPGGEHTLRNGDRLLVVGSLEELRTFRRWLKTGGTDQPTAA
ncbi:MAG: cation:proton antiporter [Opitutaceae bacterium]|nr:cation:proton antiporter [Opitutaceae bacterium]